MPRHDVVLIGVVTAGLAQGGNRVWAGQPPWPVVTVVALVTVVGLITVRRFVAGQLGLRSRRADVRRESVCKVRSPCLGVLRCPHPGGCAELTSRTTDPGRAPTLLPPRLSCSAPSQRSMRLTPTQDATRDYACSSRAIAACTSGWRPSNTLSLSQFLAALRSSPA